MTFQLERDHFVPNPIDENRTTLSPLMEKFQNLEVKEKTLQASVSFFDCPKSFLLVTFHYATREIIHQNIILLPLPQENALALGQLINLIFLNMLVGSGMDIFHK